VEKIPINEFFELPLKELTRHGRAFDTGEAVVTRKNNAKPRSRPWSEPPIELEADDLLAVPPRAEQEIDLSVDVDLVVPPAREAPFSDVTPMWSSLDVGKLTSPLFAATPWQPPAPESRARVLWRELRTRVATAARPRRSWLAGGAIAMIGAVGTCAFVSMARSPKPEGANAALVAPRAPEAPTAPDTSVVAASEARAIVNEAPADVAPRAPHKGAAREKAVEAPAPKAPAPPRGASRADAPAHAPTRDVTPLPAAAAPPAPAPRAEPPPAVPSFEAGEEFNRTAAMEAMRQAGDGSRACVTGASGGARVAVTFARSGAPADVAVEGSFAGTPAGNCIAGKFRALRIPPFRGSSVTVRRTLSF
jgi:hypothetical protein